MGWVFDNFEIDREGARLLRAGIEVPLERKTFDLLCYLAANPGRLIRKDELLERVWNASALSDGALSNTVAKLRKALGQGARDREPIETVHGRGYRFHVPQPVAAKAIPRSDPFVGRAVVLAQLTDALDRVAAGAGRLILVSGDAGIGKSRLLSELSALATARGFSAWQGSCYAGGVAPAYWPWIEILRDALSDARLRRHVPSDGWAIASLTPELLAPSTRAQDAQALRFQLFDELVRWLSAAAANTARLIIIDDLHWADHSSIELLDHLARGLARQRVVLAVALRLTAADVSEPSAQALQRLLRSGVHVPLTGLNTVEVSELVVALAKAGPESRVAELLHAKTDGNPFFVQQILQLLAQRGLPLSAADLNNSELPLAVREVIQQRLHELPSETRSLLRAAASIGRAFDAALLARVCQQPLSTVLSGLDPALRLGVLRASEQRFELTHALMCDALYDELSLEARGALHAALTRALAEQAASADARTLAELARHDLLAVPFDPESATAHACRAAAAARDASGFEAAAGIIERALERLAPESGQRERRCELLYQLGLDRFCAGDIERGRRALEKSARLASEIGASRWVVRAVCRLTGWIEVGEFQNEVTALVSQALAQVDETEPAYAILLARHAQLNPQLGAAERRRMYTRAEHLAAASGDPELMLEVANSRVSQRDPAQLAEGRAACAAYRALAERYPHALVGIRWRLALFAVELTEHWCGLLAGDLEAADLAFSRCEATAEASRVPHITRVITLIRSTRAISDGRLLDAKTCIERLREAGEIAGGLGTVWIYCELLMLEANADREALDQLVQYADVALLERVPSQRAAGAFAWMAALAARLGHTAKARTFLARTQSFDLARMPIAAGDLCVLCAVAETYASLNDASCADALYAQLSPYAALNAVGGALEYLGSVSHYLGLLALLRERPEDAVEHFQAAVVFNAKLPSPALLARSQERLQAARLLCSR
ncbi:MAG TPA: AAA family ATPase [Polyangiales bacterium]|nr:AAA family ATPase [Polyangiales bacterium]